MTTKLLGRIDWNMDRADNYHRDYHIKWLIQSDVADGPERIISCPGVPGVASTWAFGNDNDPFAYCWPTAKITQAESSSQDPQEFWILEQMFTTRPYPYQTNNITNPFAEPAKCSGNFVKYTQEARFDKNGKVIKSMSFEQVRGKTIEFDNNKPRVHIEQNYPTLNLGLFGSLVDCVSDSAMWGLPGSRMVKLSDISWTRNIWGYGFFYTAAMDFDVDYRTFDRKVPQTGTKKLLKTGADPTVPKNWVQKQDALGNVIRDIVYYKADGSEWEDPTTDPASFVIQYYPEANLFVLGIPASF